MTDQQPRVTTTITSVFKFGYKATAGQLKDWVESIPVGADITVSRYEGDAREPTETTITATYPQAMRND